MLGIRLSAEDENRLARHAKDLGRAKSAIARDWIVERLERDSVDAMMANAARLLAADAREREQRRGETSMYDTLAALDKEDGGYDWGPGGPPR